MVKFYEPKRRRRFDEDADWLPPRNRPFAMKQPKAEPKSESLPPQESNGTKKTTDKEGLGRAYASDNNFYRSFRHTPRGGHARRLSRIRLDGEIQN